MLTRYIPLLDAAATDAAVDPTGQLISTVVMMVAMVGAFYFLLIRPQRKKDKKVKDMLAALKVSDRITTIGGVHGTVISIKDDIVTVVVGPDKLKLVFARWAIRSIEDAPLENDAEALV